jgi:nicotinamidase-related amidase
MKLDPGTTALVLIDLQNGILSMPLVPYDANAVLAKSLALGRAFRQVGGTVILVRVAFAADAADRLAQPVDAPMAVRPGALPADWSDFPAALTDLAPEVVITKKQWGAFHGTELDLQLRRRGIGTIVLGGIATNFGVESTAREAWQHNYAVVLAEDACTSTGPEMHAFAIGKIMPRLARVRSSAEIIGAIGASAD